VAKMFKKLLKYLILPIFSLIILVLLFILAYRWYITSDEEKINKITTPNGIESLEKIKIGGIDQWIYIRGNDKSKPLILFLHGGPGGSAMPFAKVKYQGELEKHFVIIHWDQRATGKSFSGDIPKETITIKQFVNDTIEVTKFLLKKFKRKKLYLIGHSWGSILGIHTISKDPSLFYAYIGVGQVVNMMQGEKISYDFTLRMANERGNQDAINELTKIGPPPYKNYLSNIMIQRKWLGEFEGVIYGERNPMRVMAIEYFSCPQYSFWDLVYRFYNGMIFSITHVGDEFNKVNFIDTITEFKVPVYFFTGRHDYNVPFELTERYFQKINAPIKKLIWFEKSAHSPNWEEPKKFSDIIIGQVLSETYEKNP